MTAAEGIDPDLTPEQREWVLRMNAEMDRRRKENDYAPRPEIPEKMDSMAPGVRVVREADRPPVAFPRERSDDTEEAEDE